MSDKIGDRFQQETKYTRETLSGGRLDWSRQPPLYKLYPDSKRIALPAAVPSEMPLDQVLRQRKSARRFSEEPLSLPQLAYLLWASGGIQREQAGHAFRTAPSAGALYPIETYVVANRVTGLPQGVYHYAVRDHVLEELRLGDYGERTAQAALGQRMCAQAQVVFIWSAVVERSRWKYKQRCYRYIYLDAGHVAENLALATTALGLGSCQIGALFDDECNKIVGVDGVEESVIYMSVVGHPK